MTLLSISAHSNVEFSCDRNEFHQGQPTLEPSSETLSQSVYQPRQHIPQLDGLRGLAILLVTLYRFGRSIPESHAGGLLVQTIELGTHGVELFFVLSGFLITGILLDTRGQTNQLRNFFARRGLRIFPLYFAALALCVWFIPTAAALTGLTSIEQAFAPAQEQQFYLWCYLTNVQMSVVDAWSFGPLDHFWSLAVEEHFYLMWPIVIVFCRSRTLLWTTVMLAIGCAVSRTAWLALGGTATAAEVLTVWRCEGLLMGAFIAMLVRSPDELWQRTAQITRWAWLPLVCVAIAVDATDRRIWMINTTVWSAVWFCVLLNLVASKRSGWLSWFFGLTWLRGLGKHSYGMYVFQAPLIPLAAAMGWVVGVSLSMDLMYVVSMFALTVAIAWCSWHGFEKHWLRLKEYFPQSETGLVKRGLVAALKRRWWEAGAAR